MCVKRNISKSYDIFLRLLLVTGASQPEQFQLPAASIQKPVTV